MLVCFFKLGENTIRKKYLEYLLCRKYLQKEDMNYNPHPQEFVTNLSANLVMPILDKIALSELQNCFTRQLTYR